MSNSRLDAWIHDLHDARERLDERLAVCEDADRVAWALCEFAGRELELDDCVVYLTTADARAVSQRAAWGAKRVAERMFDAPIRLGLAEGVVGSCALIGAPQLVPDTRLDLRYVTDDAQRLSELAVPLLADGRVLGVIDCEHADADFFNSRHVRALLAIAAGGVTRLLALEK